MATHSSILAWRIPTYRGAWWLMSMGSQKVTHNWVTKHSTIHTVKIQRWPIGKDPDAGKDWGQEEKGTTEHEMVAWHHWLNAHKLEQTQGGSEGKESLACCSPRGRKELDMTEQLHNNNNNIIFCRVGGVRYRKSRNFFIHLSFIPKPDLSLMIQSCSKKLSKAIKRSVESNAFGWRRSNTNTWNKEPRWSKEWDSLVHFKRRQTNIKINKRAST